MTWKPIDSAPRAWEDGDRILAYIPSNEGDEQIMLLEWEIFWGSGEGNWRIYIDGQTVEPELVTHYMDLPPPPEEKSPSR